MRVSGVTKLLRILCSVTNGWKPLLMIKHSISDRKSQLASGRKMCFPPFREAVRVSYLMLKSPPGGEPSHLYRRKNRG